MTEAKIEPRLQRSDHRSELLLELYVKLTTTLRGVPLEELISGYRERINKRGYEFSGTITDRFIELIGREPTPTEVILLVERDVPFYGAYCCISGRNVLGAIKERD